eukprot:CCRYP_019408-RA/>CCRYP_019408-RA protein AED:0.32 eAED:0.37 QI:0/0/0/1/0/0/6/0/251
MCRRSNGLNREGLLHLIDDNVQINHFDQSKLGEGRVIHKVDNVAGVKARNNMHNRVQADAFLPPGANHFVADPAHQLLFDEAGVIIVKDLSVNNAGVATSSQRSRETYRYARLEAKLWFCGFKKFRGDQWQSNSTTDPLTVAFELFSGDDNEILLTPFRLSNHNFFFLCSAQLPKTMTDLSLDHVCERVPPQYITNVIISSYKHASNEMSLANFPASKWINTKGNIIEMFLKGKLAEVALSYLEAGQEIAM